MALWDRAAGSSESESEQRAAIRVQTGKASVAKADTIHVVRVVAAQP